LTLTVRPLVLAAPSGHPNFEAVHLRECFGTDADMRLAAASLRELLKL
jgi:hypothetical protein